MFVYQSIFDIFKQPFVNANLRTDIFLFRPENKVIVMLGYELLLGGYIHDCDCQ